LEGDQELVKRPGWVVTHLYMEATLGISQYSYPLVQLAKKLCLSYYCLCLLFNKIREKGRTGSAWKQGYRGKRERVGGREEEWPK
jgi:hypothetical protein